MGKEVRGRTGDRNRSGLEGRATVVMMMMMVVVLRGDRSIDGALAEVLVLVLVLVIVVVVVLL